MVDTGCGRPVTSVGVGGGLYCLRGLRIEGGDRLVVDKGCGRPEVRCSPTSGDELRLTASFRRAASFSAHVTLCVTCGVEHIELAGVDGSPTHMGLAAAAGGTARPRCIRAPLNFSQHPVCTATMCLPFTSSRSAAYGRRCSSRTRGRPPSARCSPCRGRARAAWCR